MKITKILNTRLAAILLILASLLALSSCDAITSLFGDAVWDAHQSKPTVFYGVGDRISDPDNTCVLIPGIGHVAMPALEEGTAPEFSDGDLIEIVFPQSSDLALMECYPARFGAKASSIKVTPANIDIEIGDGSFFITVDIPSELSGVAKEDNLVYKKLVEDEGGAFEKEYCDAVVKSTDGERMTLLVTVEPDELLEELFYERLYLEYAE